VLKQKNSKKQGDVGLGSAIAWFTSQGYTVCIPLTDSQDYDLVVEIDDMMLRVQVKTTTQKNVAGSYVVGLRTLGGNQSFHTIKKFDKEKVDYIFVLTEDGSRYFIPSNDVEVKSQLTLSKCELYKL